jgi:hypothetical protein
VGPSLPHGFKAHPPRKTNWDKSFVVSCIWSPARLASATEIVDDLVQFD